MRRALFVDYLRVRLDPDLKRRLEAIASAEGASVSDLARRKLRTALGGVRYDEPDAPPPAGLPAMPARAAA